MLTNADFFWNYENLLLSNAKVIAYIAGFEMRTTSSFLGTPKTISPFLRA